jgi:hypothetical protein
MPQQPVVPGKSCLASKGGAVSDAFARLSDTLARSANRGQAVSAGRRMAQERVREALSAFGATIGQEVEMAGEAAAPGRPSRAPADSRPIVLAYDARCGDMG